MGLLDKRIEKLSDILTCADIEEAKQYINQPGYFADIIRGFEDLSCRNNNVLGILDNIKSGDSPFCTEVGKWHWRYFIPACRLKPIEKKFRPFTLMEFTEKFKIGLPIKFRRKGKKETERYLILNGYQNEHEQYNDQTVTFIHLGAYPYSLKELFDGYEWQSQYTSTEDFEPFGVEE